MKKRMRKKIPKLRSKKGMTLVEILAGVVIIVIVFGSTLSAMTNGFSSTLRNATANRDAVEGESANEMIFQAIVKQNFTKSDTDDKTMGGQSYKSKLVEYMETGAAEAAAKSVIPEMQYVAKDQYDASNLYYKFTVYTDDTTVDVSQGNKIEISGIVIETAVKTTNGYVTNVSFVPFAN